MDYLIYLSSAASLYTDKDLEKILTVSRRNNERLNVTGLLMYHEGTILQILEGEKSTIQTLYAKILNDPRHINVFKMSEGVIENRQFSEWSMGFKKLSDKDWSEFSNYVDLDIQTILSTRKPISNPEMLGLINTFVKVNMERSLTRSSA